MPLLAKLNASHPKQTPQKNKPNNAQQRKKGLVVVVVEKEVKCLENMRKADSRKAKLLS